MKQKVVSCLCLLVSVLFMRSATAQNIHIPVQPGDSTKVVLLSEVHNVGVNKALQYDIIEQLSKKGFRHVLLEMPFSYSIIANGYMKTGDKFLLEQLATTCEQKAFWQKAYALQQTLPPNQQIHFWGLDFEVDKNRIPYWTSALQVLSRFYRYPQELRNIFMNLPPSASKNEVMTAGFEIQTYLQKNFRDTSEGMQLLRILLNRTPKAPKNRDAEMYKAFQEIDVFINQRYETPKYFGAFEVAHVNPANKSAFAMNIQGEASQWRNAVMLIGTQYVHCKASAPGEKVADIENVGMLKGKPAEALDAIAKQTQGAKIEVYDQAIPGLQMMLVIYNSDGEKDKSTCP
ncbi:hypothetical protein LX64_01629 [Chitinophaga skermanii]|uniref:TraB/GumN family protein n=1 Tax=Chitinophaga skermanii TaxID=331697 RepID=A0A327QS32_9BACT|nr:erythromycin esterase family protein [Chitinophaga skermanii]RAJ06502.1 hypothetical protein LX64_01629 [Chitinophaga skermanii]